MTPTLLHALKSLSELALTVPAAEPLVIYDAVAILATRLAETSPPPPQDRDLQTLAAKATVTAEAIRAADECEFVFRRLLGGVEE